LASFICLERASPFLTISPAIALAHSARFRGSVASTFSARGRRRPVIRSHIQASYTLTLTCSRSLASTFPNTKSNAICRPAREIHRGRAGFCIRRKWPEEETPVGCPSFTPISGNGLMPRAYEVVNHAGQIGIPPSLQVMLDDR